MVLFCFSYTSGAFSNLELTAHVTLQYSLTFAPREASLLFNFPFPHYSFLFLGTHSNALEEYPFVGMCFKIRVAFSLFLHLYVTVHLEQGHQSYSASYVSTLYCVIKIRLHVHLDCGF